MIIKFEHKSILFNIEIRSILYQFIFISIFEEWYKGCPKINARFEFVAIFALSCWQSWKKNSLTAESLRLVKMERYTIQQCVFIIEQYFKNNESLAAAIRKFYTKYDKNNVLSTVKRLIEKFVEIGSVG